MSIADHIALVNRGRIEQVGAPREIYERPASDFVMGFLGPVTRLGERLVRPHDLIIDTEPSGDSVEAMVTRVVHLGFEVRVELALGGDGVVSVQTTRAHADQLELRGGDIVYIRDGGAPAVIA